MASESSICSFNQEDMLQLQELHPNLATYNNCTAVRISVASQQTQAADAIRHALQALMARHSILRTHYVYSEVNGQYLQFINPPDTVGLPYQYFDLRQQNQDPRAAQALVGHILHQEANTPLNPLLGPPWRVVQLQLSDGEHVLSLAMHHVLSDGYTMGIFVQELVGTAAAYSAQGGSSSPPPIPAPAPEQYVDYAIWQKEEFRRGAYGPSLAYWKEKLAGAPPVLELPTDRTRPPHFSQLGARVFLKIEPELVADVKKVGTKAARATLFQTLLAAYKLLLSRYSRQDDIVVGTPFANRTNPRFRDSLGYFANTLAMRTSLAGNPTFAELLGRVRETALQAFDHADVPFIKVVEAVATERSAAHTPVFQAGFVMQPSRQLQLAQGAGGSASSWETLEGFYPAGSQTDIWLNLGQTAAGGVEGHIEYSTDIFTEATILRFVENYKALLASIVRQPTAPIMDLDIMPESERRLILEGFNKQNKMPPTPQEPWAAGLDQCLCLHEMFELQAARQPDAPCLWEDGVTLPLSYKEVDIRASAVARRLRALGVGPDVPVGLLVDRSALMIIGMLAIHKAGGCYVALDPTYPAERLAYIVEDVRAPVLLTHKQLHLELAAQVTAQVIEMDRIPEEEYFAEPASRAADVPGPRPDGRSVAFIVYTSGSTGKPKGVMVLHGSVVHLIRWFVPAMGRACFDTVLQHTSMCFDVSAWEIFTPLAVGGAQVLPQPKGHLDTQYLMHMMRDTKVTWLSMVPSQSALLVADCVLNNLELPDVLLMNLAGEPLPPTLARDVARWMPNAAVHNSYGPTECTIICTTTNGLDRAKPDRPLNVGGAIPRVPLYVLDSRLRPVPIGVPGEMYCAGELIARGYWARPDLSAERFLPNPFSTGEHDRVMFKSGDLVKWLPDGNMEVLGRLDNQVKVRGFRIELGEIETVLGDAPGVDLALVVLHKLAAQAENRIVAYVTPASVDVAALKEWVEHKLPAHMVPSLIMPLDDADVPKLPNQKADRKRLPAPVWAQLTDEDAFEAPRGALDEAIRGVFEEVLGLQGLSIHADFFRLGGTSLMAGVAMSQIRKATGAQVAGILIFQERTIAKMADAIAELERDSEDSASSSGGSSSDKLDGSNAKLDAVLADSADLTGPLLPPPPISPFMTLGQFFVIVLARGMTGAVFFAGIIVGAKAYTWFPQYNPWAVTAVAIAPILLGIVVGLLITAPVLKWLVCGRLKPGQHTLWGFGYFRWWAVRVIYADVKQMVLPFFLKTELLCWYFRLLGAKIGSDVVICSLKIEEAELISIGQGVYIGKDAFITGASMAASPVPGQFGTLTLLRTTVGGGCTIGRMAQVSGDLPADTLLPPMESSRLPSTAKPSVAHNEIRTQARPTDTLAALLAFLFILAAHTASLGPFWAGLGYLWYGGFPISSLEVFRGFLECIIDYKRPSGAFCQLPFGYRSYLATILFPTTVVAGAVIYATICVAAKWLLVWRFTTRNHNDACWLRRLCVHTFARLIDSPLYDIALSSIGATWMMSAYLRAMGARIGRGIALQGDFRVLEFDLLSIGDYTISGGVSTAVCATVAGSAPIKIAHNCVVANSVTLFPGTVMEPFVVLGNHSWVPQGKKLAQGAVVQGSTVLYTQDLETGSGKPTTPDGLQPPECPGPGYFAYGLAVVPGTMALGLLSITVLWAPMALVMNEALNYLGLLISVPIFPAAVALGMGLYLLWMGAVKAVIHPRSEGTHAFYSRRHIAWQMLTSMCDGYGNWGAQSTFGTQIVVWWQRLAGAKIGRGVTLFVGAYQEADVLDVGDGSVLLGAHLACHTIDHHKLSQLPIKVGSYATMQSGAVLQPGAALESFACLEEVSLVMKGDSVGAHSTWAGIPAKPIGRRKLQAMGR